jgi:hypothetical protein
MTRTVSARISSTRHEELRERCNKVGCSISEYIDAALEMAMNGSVQFDFGNEDGEEPEPACAQDSKPIVQGRIRFD